MRKTILLSIMFLCSIFTTNATTFTVTNTNNSGAGSLRQAISDANADTSFPTIINFNILGAGVHTITPTTFDSLSPFVSVYGPITRTMTIDATTQPGYSPGNPQIEIDCATIASTATNGSCIVILGTDNCVIKGLIIDNYIGAADGRGILIRNTVTNTANGNQISQCWLGSFPTPSVKSGNTRAIVIDGRGSAALPITNTIIGGPNTSDANVLSGNSIAGFQAQFNVNNSLIQNNKIGCDYNGFAAKGNAYGIVFIGDPTRPCNNNVIRDNLISGNTAFGIVLQTNTNGSVIQNNKIGTEVNGTAALGSAVINILVTGDPTNLCVNNLIGGSSSGQGNLISGASLAGIYLTDQANTNIIQGNLIGTNSSGTAGIPNNFGIEIQGDPGMPCLTNLIGGTAATTEGNIIDFNTANGIAFVGIPELAAPFNAPLAVDVDNDLGMARNRTNVDQEQDDQLINTQITRAGTPDILNAILGNNIYNNGAKGIDLTPASQGNNLQPAPTVDSAVLCSDGLNIRISGTAPASPAASLFRLEFFVNDANHNPITEGQRFIGAIPSIATGTNFSQLFTVSAPTIGAGTWVSATATNLNNGGNPGDTSEFTLNTLITANPALSITIAADPTEICAGDSSELTANFSGGTAPFNVEWSDGHTDVNVTSPITHTVTPPITTNYSATVVDSIGCQEASNSVTVDVDNVSVTLTGNPLNILAGQSTTLTATPVPGVPPYTLTWSDGHTDLGVTGPVVRTFTPAVNTDYTVTITDDRGCSFTSSAVRIIVGKESQISKAILEKYCNITTVPPIFTQMN